jgi:hypothetical protein
MLGMGVAGDVRVLPPLGLRDPVDPKRRTTTLRPIVPWESPAGRHSSPHQAMVELKIKRTADAARVD